MIIRKIEPRDNIAVAKIIKEVLEEHNVPKIGTAYSDPEIDHLSEVFNVPKSDYWVVESEGKIVGSGGIYPTKGLPKYCVELVKLYLSHESRGKGIGKALLEKCINTAKLHGYTQMYLETLPSLDKAVYIYERIGFKHIDKPMGNTGHTSCNIWMVKNL